MTRQITVSTDRLDVHVHEAGPQDGEPVLFLHGNLSDGSVWAEQMGLLPEGFRGIACDLRGYGATDPEPIDATGGCRDWADDVASLVDALGLERFHLVAHSMGAGVALQLALDRPRAVRSIALAASMSPYGFGGTRLDGSLCAPDYAGSGGGAANPELVDRIAAGDRSTESPVSPRNVVRSLFFPDESLVRDEDAIVEAMLRTRTGEDHYPGDVVESPHWPHVAPGERGTLNAISPRFCDLSLFAEAGPPVPVLWVQGSEDRIISDASMVDLGNLGALGAVPGWPGDDTFPPQPMVSQTRELLEAHGGPLREEMWDGVGHFPFTQEPQRFAAALAEHLASSS